MAIIWGYNTIFMAIIQGNYGISMPPCSIGLGETFFESKTQDAVHGILARGAGVEGGGDDEYFHVK